MLPMIEKQVHILIGCADARDLNQVQVDALRDNVLEFGNKGIEVEFHAIRTPGSFVSPDVIMDIKRTFEQAQRNSNDIKVPISYYVHIQTHGHLTEDSSEAYISHVHDLHVVENSPYNCGMLNATSLGVEIEKLIVEARPEFEFEGNLITVDNDTKIKLLLKEHYAYDGYLAGDWISSIDSLCTHPRHQRTLLKKSIDSDSELKILNIQITCGVMDYAIHSLIRVDDGDPKVPFWDSMQAQIRKNSTNKRTLREFLINLSKKQKPLAGLLCMSDPRQSSRVVAAEYYLKSKGIDHGGGYLPNTVFNMTGSSFDIPSTPFGPYVIAGFFYSVKQLGLTSQLVMGYDTNQTNRIIQKIGTDPIMSIIVKKYSVNLIPINQLDVMPKEMAVA